MQHRVKGFLAGPTKDRVLKDPSRTVSRYSRLASTVFIIYMAMLVFLTHAPGDMLGDYYSVGTSLFDERFFHFFAYAGLTTLLLAVAMTRYGLPRPCNSVLLSAPLLVCLFLAGTLGILDEVTQPWTGRECSLDDWLADLGGSAAAALTVTCIVCTRRWYQARDSCVLNKKKDLL